METLIELFKIAVFVGVVLFCVLAIIFDDKFKER